MTRREVVEISKAEYAHPLSNEVINVDLRILYPESADPRAVLGVLIDTLSDTLIELPTP